jgi:hypothetical protein
MSTLGDLTYSPTARRDLNNKALPENSMRSNRTYIGPDLSTLTAAIAHSQIVVTLAVAQRFLPVGFDDQDVAILQWIAAERRHAKRSYL